MGDRLTVFQALDPEAPAALAGSEDVQSVRIVHHLGTNRKRSQASVLTVLMSVITAASSNGRVSVSELSNCGRPALTAAGLTSPRLYLKRVLVGAGDHFSSVLYNLCTSDAVQLNRTSPELFLLMQTVCQQQLLFLSETNSSSALILNPTFSYS